MLRLVLIFMLSVLLAACGRKGALEPPPGQPQTQNDSGSGQNSQEEQKPKGSFVLDRLL